MLFKITTLETYKTGYQKKKKATKKPPSLDYSAVRYVRFMGLQSELAKWAGACLSLSSVKGTLLGLHARLCSHGFSIKQSWDKKPHSLQGWLDDF